MAGGITHLSLDQDLGDDAHGTGYDVVLWIEEQVAITAFQPPEIVVHSANVTSSGRLLGPYGYIFLGPCFDEIQCTNTISARQSTLGFLFSGRIRPSLNFR
jgi:hypothetical protein